MAERRKVANLLALAVLATVVQRPMHPYEIASLLRARGKDDDMEIKWGSLWCWSATRCTHRRTVPGRARPWRSRARSSWRGACATCRTPDPHVTRPMPRRCSSRHRLAGRAVAASA